MNSKKTEKLLKSVEISSKFSVNITVPGRTYARQLTQFKVKDFNLNDKQYCVR